VENVMRDNMRGTQELYVESDSEHKKVDSVTPTEIDDFWKMDEYDIRNEKGYGKEIKSQVQMQESLENTIFESSKQKYDKKVNLYMNMNFWGKAKTMLTGKKPKNFQNGDTLSTSRHDSIMEILQPTFEKIELLRQDEIKNIEKIYSQLSEEEKQKREKEMGVTLENRIKQINSHYNREIEEIKEKYNNNLNKMTEKGGSPWV